MSISLCMIVKNEEDTLKGCLNSVRDIVDEIIIVDTGSTDHTPDVAKKSGAKIFHHPWADSFAEARNFSLSKASCDWILVMDADDRLDPADKPALVDYTVNGSDSIDVYCCQTLCYSGKTLDSNNMLINMNVRLIRNRKGIYYKGRVHEQVLFPYAPPEGPYPMFATEIRFHHLGYLSSQIEKKEKHKRNIGLIKKELKDDPENGFMLFNIGNEYMSMGKIKKAFGCYKRSFQKFNPSLGYSTQLLSRMVLCCERLNRESDLLYYADFGLKSFPVMTDFQYLIANTFQRQKKYGAAIRGYKKCIKMGTPPPNCNSVAGVATFKPHYALAGIYSLFGDDDRALLHCRKAVRLNPYFCEAYAKMADLLLKKHLEPSKIRKTLTRYAKSDTFSLLMLSDILYDRSLYGEALKLNLTAKKAAPENPTVHYNEGICRFYLKQYQKAYACLLKADTGVFRSRAALFRYLCVRFSPDPDTAHVTLSDFRKSLDQPYYKTAKACEKLLAEHTCKPLAKNAPLSQKYIRPIFDLLELMLKNSRFKDFIKAEQLLNLITDNSVFLRLGKLYYKYGYTTLAYRELLLSIQQTEQMDTEGFLIMKNTQATAKTP